MRKRKPCNDKECPYNRKGSCEIYDDENSEDKFEDFVKEWNDSTKVLNT